MSKKILIDAFYPEETKFILSDDNQKLEEFYYQNSQKKLIKGNIYLGKVNRIEPSLQAAFIDYGNDKKGFLSFEMIYPKYYQMPVADKEEMISKIKEIENTDNANGLSSKTYHKNDKKVFTNDLYNNYKIQEVIKKDQIILVQVEKEERGNKGAFLTTYISLSGRYCVFSPNSFKSTFGISKKLDDSQERDRLKSISLELLEKYNESNLILRTASAYRTKAEIKRDFQYLTKTWEQIKNLVISSYAPSLVYEDGDILINGIKDHYTSEVNEIVVSGDEAYEKIEEFLKVFIPTNIHKLHKYSNQVPILRQYNIEKYLHKLYSNIVQLKSGGYLVINSTEALVSIDVNSGTYTEEYSVENMALNINLEAALEIVKQVRFRGLSGLIVIDFIDMLNLQNKKQVERELKKAFWEDKVKVHIGRISEFGLLEMSRQRVGRSFVESNSKVCPTCSGKGRITLNNSIATLLIGKLKFMLCKKKAKLINIIAHTDIIISLMNRFKSELCSLENLHQTKIDLVIDDVISLENYKIIFHKSSDFVSIKSRRYVIPEYVPTNSKYNVTNVNYENNKMKNTTVNSSFNKKCKVNYNNTESIKKKIIEKPLSTNNLNKKNKGILLKRFWSKIIS